MQQIIQALVLGLIQGLSEFIPVSSSGHLILANRFLGFNVGGFVFDTVLNVGTLAALVIYFRRDIKVLVLSTLRPKTHGNLGWLVILATIPAGLAGWFLQDIIENSFRSIYVVIAMLAIVGIAMLVAEAMHSPDKTKTITAKDALIVGLAQVLALIPGTSRSGITIMAGMGRKFSREAAARFSFLLALPVLGGGVAKVVLSDGVMSEIAANQGIYLAGVISAFISGLLAIHFMLRFLSTSKLNVFAWYRIGLAAILLVVVNL